MLELACSYQYLIQSFACEVPTCHPNPCSQCSIVSNLDRLLCFSWHSGRSLLWCHCLCVLQTDCFVLLCCSFCLSDSGLSACFRSTPADGILAQAEFHPHYPLSVWYYSQLNSFDLAPWDLHFTIFDAFYSVFCISPILSYHIGILLFGCLSCASSVLSSSLDQLCLGIVESLWHGSFPFVDDLLASRHLC